MERILGNKVESQLGYPSRVENYNILRVNELLLLLLYVWLDLYSSWRHFPCAIEKLLVYSQSARERDRCV